MRARSIHLVMLFALIAFPAPSFGQKAPDRQQAEVTRFVHDYMAAIDSGDVRSQMEMVSRDPQVTSTVMGESWRGWDAIRAQSEAYVPVSKRIRNVIDRVDVISLGPAAAIAVAPFRSQRRDSSDRMVPEFQQSLTLVLRRTSAGWKMIHEHVSVKIPPPAVKKEAEAR